MADDEPTLKDVLSARQSIAVHLQRTPLHRYPGIDEIVGAETWIKHENHHAVGAFKVRGGVHLATKLTASERRAGLYTASTGNHGQSIAYAAKVTGGHATIAVPEGLATRVPFAHTQRIMRHPQLGLDDFVLVSDAEMEEAIRLLLRHTGNLAEHAGAAPLAAALRIREQLVGRRVALILSGGNLGYESVRRIVAEGAK